MKKIFILLILLQVMAAAAIAQGRVVSGTVTDTAGPIPSASVWEKGLQSNGTATDNAGNFRLTLKGNSNTIIIRSIGYAQKEVKITGSAPLAISLEFAAIEEEGDKVVVIAYGRQKKITMTGAVSQISGEELRLNPAASIQNAMVGRMPGLFSQQVSGQPGADAANLFIRGQSSFNAGSSSPLLVVDDIEVDYSQFQRMDPNEIETLSILKDASTTAVYGIRGANGVIVVTTRRGKIGTPKIALNTQASISQPTRLPDYLDSYETGRLFNEALYNDWVRNGRPNNTPPKPRFSDSSLALFKSGADPYGHPNVDWQEVLFKKFSQQYKANVDISGGTESVKYFVSAGYLFQDGMVKNYSQDQDVNGNYYHKRFNYRSNLDVKITQTTDLRIDLFGNIGEVNRPNAGTPNGINSPSGDLFYDFSSFKTLAPFAYPVYNPNGTFGYSKWQRDEIEAAYNRNNVVGRLTYMGYYRNYESNMNIVSSVNQKLAFITQGLTFTGRLAYKSNYGYSRSVTRGVDDFPSFIYNAATGGYEGRQQNFYRIRRFNAGYSGGGTGRALNLQAILNYDRTFGVHHLYGLLLASTNSEAAGSSNPDYSFVPNNVRTYTARLGYDYKQKYLFQFNAGYNGSDRFVGDRRYGFFPAGSAGWNISEEPFFKNNVPFMNRLKIRGSYGIVGNDKIGNNFTYNYLYSFNTNNGVGGAANFGTSPSTGGHNNAITEGRLGNRNVSWEKERKADLGLEMGFFNNRLSATLEYFNNNRWDILIDRSSQNSAVSRIFGALLPSANLGEVNNKGYEAELSWRDDISKNFSYFVKANFSFARNKILFQDEPTPLFAYQSYTGNSIGQVLGYVWTGSFYKDSADIARSPVPLVAVFPGDLKYADINGDNKVNADDRRIIGNPNVPNTTFGLNLGGRFKGLSFSLLFQGVRGASVSGAAEAIQAFGANLTRVHLNAWTPQRGDNAAFPILTNATPGISNPTSFPSSFWLIDADYVRLRNAEASYALPKSLVGRLKLQEIRVYANGNNLWLWTNLSKLYDFDPEITSGSTRVNYPPQRTYNLGLNITF